MASLSGHRIDISIDEKNIDNVSYTSFNGIDSKTNNFHEFDLQQKLDYCKGIIEKEIVKQRRQSKVFPLFIQGYITDVRTKENIKYNVFVVPDWQKLHPGIVKYFAEFV